MLQLAVQSSKIGNFGSQIGLTSAKSAIFGSNIYKLAIFCLQYYQNRVSNNQLLLPIYCQQFTGGNGKSNLPPVMVYRR